MQQLSRQSVTGTLVADHQASNRELLEGFLMMQHFTVVAARDGASTLGQPTRTLIHLVRLNIMTMPRSRRCGVSRKWMETQQPIDYRRSELLFYLMRKISYTVFHTAKSPSRVTAQVGRLNTEGKALDHDIRLEHLPIQDRLTRYHS